MHLLYKTGKYSYRFRSWQVLAPINASLYSASTLNWALGVIAFYWFGSCNNSDYSLLFAGYYVAGFGGSFTLVCDSTKLLEKLSEQSEENQLTQSEQSQLTQSERSQLTQSERNQQIKVEKRQLKFAEEVSQEKLVEKKELKRKLLKKKKAEDNFEETERNVVISWDSDADIFSTKSRKVTRLKILILRTYFRFKKLVFFPFIQCLYFRIPSLRNILR